VKLVRYHCVCPQVPRYAAAKPSLLSTVASKVSHPASLALSKRESTVLCVDGFCHLWTLSNYGAVSGNVLENRLWHRRILHSGLPAASAWVASADGRVSAQVLRGLRTLALDVCLSMDTDSLEHEQRLECWGDACTALHAWWVTAALDAGGKLLPCTHEHFSARSTPVIVCVGEHMEP